MPVTRARIDTGLDRAAAVFEDAMMNTTVRVFTRAEPAFNATTGTWDPDVETTLYTGKAYLRLGQARPVKRIEVGESDNVTREWRLRVPRGTATFPPGAVVAVTVNARATEMVGERFRVEDSPNGTNAITPVYALTAFEPVDYLLP